MVQATIITSYCLQAQLLQAHLVFLKERLLNKTITPLNWMRVSKGVLVIIGKYQIKYNFLCYPNVFAQEIN